MPKKRRATTSGRAPRRRRDGRHGGKQRRSGPPELRIFFGPEPGPGVVQAPLAEVLEALARQPEDLDFPSVADQILPVIPRIRPYPDGAGEGLRMMVAPGIMIGFGIDIGPAFLNVSPALLDTWAISPADLAARALQNLHRRAETVERATIHRGSIGEVATEWLQTGESVGSTLVMAPGELRRLFEGPRFFITPMRDLIIGLPPDVDRGLALWLWSDIAADDPNCLGPMGYRFDGVRVTPEPLDPEGRIPGDQGADGAGSHVA